MRWQDIKRKLKHQFSEITEIPTDVMLDLPKIVAVGNLSIFLENHRGISEYTPELVRVITGEGEIEIAGNGLKLKNILPDEICIEGSIRSISFIE